MARKRNNGKTKADVTPQEIAPLMQSEAQYFQNW